jgi:hypothetical protein
MPTFPIAAAALLIMLTGAASAGLPTTPGQPGALAQATPRALVTPEPAINPLTKGDGSGIEETGPPRSQKLPTGVGAAAKPSK